MQVPLTPELEQDREVEVLQVRLGSAWRSRGRAGDRDVLALAASGQRGSQVVDLGGRQMAEVGDDTMRRHPVGSAVALDELGVGVGLAIAGDARDADVHRVYGHCTTYARLMQQEKTSYLRHQGCD